MYFAFTNMLNKYFDKFLIATAGGVSASTLTYILMDCERQKHKRQISESHKKEIEQIKKTMF